jgi:predicted nucleic acid-binding protein
LKHNPFVLDTNIESLFDGGQLVDVDRSIATRAGRYAGQFRESLSGISQEDFLFAVTARIHGYPLWTANRKHLPMQDIDLIREVG